MGNGHSETKNERRLTAQTHVLVHRVQALANQGGCHHRYEHILTAVQQLFTQAGYATDRKNVPHSRGKKKANLHVKDFRLEGIRNVIST